MNYASFNPNPYLAIFLEIRERLTVPDYFFPHEIRNELRSWIPI